MFPANRMTEKRILENINRLVHLLIDMSYTNSSSKEPFFNEAVSLLRETRPLLLNLVEGREEHLESLVRQLVLQKLPHPFILGSFGDLRNDLERVITSALKEEISPMITPVAEEEASSPIITPIAEEEEAVPIVTPGAKEEEVSPIVTPDAEGGESAPLATASEEREDSFSPPNTGETLELPQAEIYVLPAESPPVQEEPLDEPLVEPVMPAPLPDTSKSTGPENTEDAQSLDMLAFLNKTYPGETIIVNYTYRSIVFDYYLPQRRIAIISSPLQARSSKLYGHLLKKEGISLVELSPTDPADTLLLKRKLKHL